MRGFYLPFLLALVLLSGCAGSQRQRSQAPVNYADRIVAELVFNRPIADDATFLILNTPDDQLYARHLAHEMGRRRLAVISDLNNAFSRDNLNLRTADSSATSPVLVAVSPAGELPDSDYAVTISVTPYGYSPLSRDNVERMIIQIIDRVSNVQIASYSYDRSENDWTNYRYIIDNFLDQLSAEIETD